MVENIVGMDAYRLARLIVTEWSDAYSDNGAVWVKSHEALALALKFAPQGVQDEAYRIANKMWSER